MSPTTLSARRAANATAVSVGRRFRRYDPPRAAACFSSSAASESAPDGNQNNNVEPFTYPNAEKMFTKIISQCSKEDVSMLGVEINKILGRTFYENEFYYTGFGQRRGGGGKAATSDDVTEAAAAADEKKTVDLKLVGFDAKAKIKVIKEVRANIDGGLGLKEAKALVDGAPTILQKNMSPDQAAELQAKLTEVGAQIELV